MIGFKLHDGAVLPERGSPDAAGLDLIALEDVVLQAYERKTIPTGLQLAYCPKGVYLRVAPRSKLAHTFGIDVQAGVVDHDYRGMIGVILRNTSSEAVTIKAGSGMAQLITEVIKYFPVREMDVQANTARGEKGIHCKEQR